MEPLSSPRSITRSSSRTPCSGPSCPGCGFGSRKYRSPTTTPTFSKTKAWSIRPPISHWPGKGRGVRRLPLSPGQRRGVQHWPSVSYFSRSQCELFLPLWRAVDVNLRAWGRDQGVEEVRDVHRDPDAAVRGRADRHVGVAVDRVSRADEKHRVVHLAEGYRYPARHEVRGVVRAVGGDRLRAAVGGAVVVVAPAA